MSCSRLYMQLNLGATRGVRVADICFRDISRDLSNSASQQESSRDDSD